MTTANDRLLRRAVRVALLCGGTVAATVATQTSVAQTAPAPSNDQTDTTAPITEVVVTGSRIATPALESVSPITAISSDEIKNTGTTRVEDLLNSLPQVVADQGSGLSMGSNGTATVNLRGLGIQRTLVLINGRRVMGGDPAAGAPSTTALSGTSAADINQIPVALIDRVDVLTGGAASTYGADAVAGVVNFVMNDHFEGVRIDANASIYNHTNDNPIGAIFAADGSPQPSHTVTDGAGRDITLIWGRNLADGAGNFTAYAGYRRLNPLLGADRDFSTCSPDMNTSATGGLINNGFPFHCGGSSTSYPGRFVPFNGPNAFNSYTIGGAGGNQFIPWGDQYKYNYAPSNFWQRPDERWTAGQFLHLDLTDKVQVYDEFMFMQDNSSAQIAPGGAFIGQSGGINLTGAYAGLPNGTVQVNCSNPFLSAQEQSILCAPGQQYSQFLLGRRNVEGGTRDNTLDHTSFRIVVGVKGEIAPGWKFDTYAMEGQTAFSSYATGNFSKSALANALEVTTNSKGQPVCASGASGCVPYNIFQIGGVTQAALNYVDTESSITGSTEERVWDGNITGDLGKYGLKVPGTEDGLLINVGSQFRSEYATLDPDGPLQNWDLLGTGGPIFPLNAGFQVWEGYLEGGMPLITDKPFAKELSFETGYRYSSYSEGFNTNTYKFGLNWAPSSDIRFRGSYQRAVRAP